MATDIDIPVLTADDLESSESESDGELMTLESRVSQISRDTTSIEDDESDEEQDDYQEILAVPDPQEVKPNSKSVDESFSYAKLFLTTNTVAAQLGKKAQNKCNRCDRTVYFAEQVVAAGKKYHKRCFKCTQCNKQLAQGDFAERNDSIYCKQCHGKAFGIKGYGHGVGSGVLDTYKIPNPMAKAKPVQKSEPKCPKCDALVPMNQAFCGECGTKVNEDALRDKLKGMSLQTKPAPSTNSLGAVKVKVKPDSCHRCGKIAYFAERVNGAGRWYHKRCFKCSDCKRQLDPKSMHEHESELYCHRCYMANFGAKGFGYGSDSLHFTSS